MTKFSTQCFRDFKKYIGELTATAAGIHSSVCLTADFVKQMNSLDPWSEIAAKYGIKVNGLSSENVLKSASRMNIVSLYSGFDLFLVSFMKQFMRLTDCEWCAIKDDSPFDEFYKNLKSSQTNLKFMVQEPRRVVIDYYRLSRNAIVHPSKDNIERAKGFYKNHIISIEKVQAQYSLRSAPNEFDNLNFHDVKIFARLLLDVLPIIDEAVDPGDEKLGSLIPFKSWKRLSNKHRIRNAAKGYLKQNFGVTDDRAEMIFIISNGSLA